jgi:DNA recombination protein RmuC
MVELQHVLSNKQARGAFGEVQLHDLVANVLPPSAFTLQATLSNGNRADCLLKLPDPPGAIVVDAKFPLESNTALRHARDEAARIQAGRAFSAAVAKHVRDIEERYIVPGETADSALMFLPSEAVYAEMHANFRAAVEDSFRRRVWIVSPTTLWATLNTVRSILKDVRLREQAGLLQAEMQALHDELGRLDERAGRLQRHLEQGIDDVRQVRRLAGRLSARSARIEKADFTESVDRSDDAGERSGDGAAKHAPGGSG